MEINLNAIETIGSINEKRQLVLDESLPITGPKRVRIIILLSNESEISEKEWLHSAMQNPVFDFLKDSDEDIYSLSDGRKFYDKRITQ